MLKINISSRVCALGLAVTLATSTAVAIPFSTNLSTRQEVEIGRQAAAQVESENRVVRDATVNRYIQSLGNRLARHSDRNDLGYSFKVLAHKEPNAFALPGGYIYLHSGIVSLCHNESELAGVLAHEIAHISERHSVEQMRNAQKLGFGLGLLDLLLGRQRNAAESIGALAANLVAQGVFMKYSRDAEREADRRAVDMLRSARINPNGMVTLFQRMESLRGRHPGVAGFFSSHPSLSERQQNISGVLSSSDDRLATDSRQFHSVRSRLR